MRLCNINLGEDGSTSRWFHVIFNHSIGTILSDPTVIFFPGHLSSLQLFFQKLACGEGGCGACAVVLSRIDKETGTEVTFAVNSCLRPLASIHGWSVTTNEGLGGSNEQGKQIIRSRAEKGFWVCDDGFAHIFLDAYYNSASRSRWDNMQLFYNFQAVKGAVVFTQYNLASHNFTARSADFAPLEWSCPCTESFTRAREGNA